ncbi:hypothetical protein C2845_PM15G03980 [Panicum miliaceum]|uniref:RNase H type-1 domain-containing protein n=1 Tax=Panicum miliaceum TaxID=4540 RepID=A0A3L6QCJ6_PANMI|nr:hypothetical protein C2845_PM15G03980 [Panicum miliaceum]
MSSSGSNLGKGKLPCTESSKRKQSCAGSKVLGKTAWEPPPTGWIKINVDGVFVSQTGEAGIGVIARDSERCQDAAEAEAQACAEGLRLATQ